MAPQGKETYYRQVFRGGKCLTSAAGSRPVQPRPRGRAPVFATLLEPLLILAMGAMVLGIVLAVLMPIIEINHLVR
jgi:hypothetical protein